MTRSKQSDHFDVVESTQVDMGPRGRATIVLARDKWTFRVRFDADQVAEICVTAPPGEPLTARSFRSVPMGAIERFARRVVADERRLVAHYFGNADARIVEYARAHVTERGQTLDGLAALAFLYVAACANSNNPGRDLAAELHLSTDQFYRRLRQAEAESLIDRSGFAGKSGGVLTERGQRQLEALLKDVKR